MRIASIPTKRQTTSQYTTSIRWTMCAESSTSEGGN